PQSHDNHDDHAAVDYRKHVGIVLKHRRLIAGIAAVALALGLGYTLLQTPTYRASATIQIKRAAANISGVAGLEPVETGTSVEFYQTQYELLKSRALAERVVSSLNLAENPQMFDPPPSVMGTIRGIIFASRDAQARSDSERRDWALDAVMSGLSVEPVRASTIVRISFDSANPVLAHQVANAVAENFITSNLERSFEASEHARQFLEERLLDLRLKLEDSERELVSYAKEQDILLTGSDESLTTVNLTGANTALAAAAKKRLERELQWRQVEAMGGAGLAPGPVTEAIAKLRERRSQLVLEYEEKLRTRPGYPGLGQLRTRIEEIDQQVSDEVKRTGESLRLQYEASMQEEKLLRQQLTGLKSEVMDYQNRNIQYTILQREVDTNRSLYEGLLQRYKEIGVAGGVDSGSLASNLSIVDRARIPVAPFKPSLSRNLAAALLIGLMVGGAAAFGREFLDHSYRSPEDLEEDLGLPVLGIIPLTNDVSDLKRTFSDQHLPSTEAWRSLRTALLFSTEAGVPRTMVVTSAQAGEGKSTAAVNLAGQFAKLGLRVLLIDADLRKPSLHRFLTCACNRGLSQYLTDGARPPEVFQVTAQPNLTLLPGGPLAPNPAELLAGPRMASLLGVAAEKFDLVIVDAPPVGGLADAPLLASMSIGTLLVVEADRTHCRAVAAALKRLSFARAEVVGVVFNKFDTSQTLYGYGCGDGYGDDGFDGYGDRTVPRLPGT
ncbi:MAG TPA: polysaccharide biosynthesis tyrosine autokinase, partial [Aestuariivirgaceae bacterium]|nr:polysaccharide biosynthesis tyrosine autokinase [Aestuariivirgaceae bacterium]